MNVSSRRGRRGLCTTAIMRPRPPFASKHERRPTSSRVCLLLSKVSAPRSDPAKSMNEILPTCRTTHAATHSVTRCCCWHTLGGARWGTSNHSRCCGDPVELCCVGSGCIPSGTRTFGPGSHIHSQIRYKSVSTPQRTSSSYGN